MQDEITNRLIEEVIGWRRHFHTYPELSFEEFDTAEFIASQLSEMGYQVETKVGGTGVVGTLKSDLPGKVIAFRADMDALPMMEETDLPYASVRPGIMHACGHDCHMAIALGLAKVLSLGRDRWKGTVKFVFQPGEEANGGARCVISSGALDDVEAIFALHMMPDLPTGTIGIKEGYLSATDDEFVIKVKGRGAHSSEAYHGVNAILIASHINVGLQSILSSALSPHDVATFSVCTIKGGDAINVIPDNVEMTGMLRCIKEEDKLALRGKMEKIVENTAAAYGGTAEIDFIQGFPAVNNDSALTKVLEEAGAAVLDDVKNIITIPRPHMGSEDFSYYQEKMPGTIFMLGCHGEDTGDHPLHSPHLVIDEESLQYGVKVFAQVVEMLNGVQ